MPLLVKISNNMLCGILSMICVLPTPFPRLEAAEDFGNHALVMMFLSISSFTSAAVSACRILGFHLLFDSFHVRQKHKLFRFKRNCNFAATVSAFML